jgi:hypothetical protein
VSPDEVRLDFGLVGGGRFKPRTVLKAHHLVIVAGRYTGAPLPQLRRRHFELKLTYGVGVIHAANEDWLSGD